MKALIASVEENQLDWIKKSAKNQKLKTSEFVRAMIDYLRDSSPADITSKLAKSRLMAEIEQATRKMEAESRKKESLEKELAKIEVA